jgi:hypothetical protein
MEVGPGCSTVWASWILALRNALDDRNKPASNKQVAKLRLRQPFIIRVVIFFMIIARFIASMISANREQTTMPVKSFELRVKNFRVTAINSTRNAELETRFSRPSSKSFPTAPSVSGPVQPYSVSPASGSQRAQSAHKPSPSCSQPAYQTSAQPAKP